MTSDERMVEVARLMAEGDVGHEEYPQVLFDILDKYGDHLTDCAKVSGYYAHENDCSCGWGEIRTYLRQYVRKHADWQD